MKLRGWICQPLYMSITAHYMSFIAALILQKSATSFARLQYLNMVISISWWVQYIQLYTKAFLFWGIAQCTRKNSSYWKFVRIVESWIEETCHNVMKESQSTSNLCFIYFLTRKLYWKFNNFGISSWVGACKLTNARFVDNKERWHVWRAALASSLKPFFFFWIVDHYTKY